MYEKPAESGPPANEQQRALAVRLRKRLEYFHGERKEDRKRWERNRKYVNGECGDDGEGGLVRVNLIASVVGTIQPNIYAKAPEVAVQPEQRLNPADYKQVRDFSRTLEMVLNRYAVRGTNLKARGKEAVRSALTATTGWVKVTYQKDKRTDPLIRNRIDDTQDNILQIEQLLRDTKDEGQCAQYHAKMAELKQQLSALEQQVEVVVSEGLVIDNVKSDHIVILDASVKIIDEYAQASAIAHGVYMTVGSYKAAFQGKEPPKKATRYRNPEAGDDVAQQGDARKGIDADDELVLVWEIWSKQDLTVYTLCHGADEFSRDPFQPLSLGAQWYPFFPLQLWRVVDTLYPRALVDNLVELVDEYNTRRTTAAEHRRKNKPIRLLNKASGIETKEVDRINQAGPSTDIIAVSADPNQPLQNQLGHLPEVPYNPQMYDTQDIMRDIEMVSGAQDASRGGINQAKTATEAEIMAMGMQSRTGEQLDTIEDWLTAVLQYCAELLLQNKTAEQIRAAFGQDAVWPDLQQSKKALFEQTLVQIRAGSTAKPNKMRERDQWLQFLPQMQEAVMRISELMTQGQNQLAESLMKMLDETLRRFDERMSIREYIPGLDDEDGEDGMPKLGQDNMMQMVQAKVQELTQQAEQALAQREQELQAQEQQLSQRATELQVKEIQHRAAEQVSAAQRKYEDALRKVEEERFAEQMANKAGEMSREISDASSKPDQTGALQELTQANAELRGMLTQLLELSGQLAAPRAAPAEPAMSTEQP